MSLSYTITSFCIDVSPSMGAQRSITEHVDTGDHAGATNGASDGAESSDSATRTRVTSDLEWVMELVARKIQNCILSNLKTAKVHLLCHGMSEKEGNIFTKKEHKITEGYDGIFELCDPKQPTLETLDSIRCLRPLDPESDLFPADPLGALVCAITTLNDKNAGGCDKRSKQWRRTIYVITNGETEFNMHHADEIKEEILVSNIAVKVVGIDFDDPSIGFKEENKSPVKARAEEFWHDFLADVPGSGVATAANVIAQSSLPSIQMQGSAPFSTMLTFGDPGDADNLAETVRIPVKMYKATAVARPISAGQISKISRDSVAAARKRDGPSSSPSGMIRTPSKLARKPRETNDDVTDSDQEEPEKVSSFKVERHRKYYIREELERMEGGITSVKSLPEGAEADFARAYKLGATLIAINADIDTKMDTQDGIEIIQYTNEHSYRRYFNMGESNFVFASDDNVRAQGLLSSLIRSMVLQSKYAIVRHVRRNGSDPRIGILAPQPYDKDNGYNYEALFYCDAPFRQDYTRNNMQPLNRVVSISGEESTEHTSLPTKEMLKAVDQLIDAQDLTDADEDEDGEPMPWFRTVESYNPAIHNTRDALARRVFLPQDRTLPAPHAEVAKFLQTPEKVLKRSAASMEHCQGLFDLNYAATGVLRRSRERRERQEKGAAGNAGPKEIDLGGIMDDELAAENTQKGGKAFEPPADQVPDSITPKRSNGQPDSPARMAPSAAASGSDTEDDDDEIVLSTPSKARPQAYAESSLDIAQVDEHTGLVTNSAAFSREDPIGDFEKKLASPESSVESIIDSMGELITKTVTSSFGSNDYTHARDLLIAMRKGSTDYEEAARYNAYLRGLKARALEGVGGTPKERARADFWDDFVRGREDVGLITDGESIEGPTGVSARAAGEFINL